MGKHAYLIIAHNNFNLLKKLIDVLNYEKNDIFLHIDKKSGNFDFESIRALCTKSKIYFAKRLSVNWGGYSQIKCEMRLFEMAYRTAEYDFMHLISGVDFPLKPQEEIHRFFEENKHKNFIHFDRGEFNFSNIGKKTQERRVERYSYFEEYMKRGGKIGTFANKCNFKLLELQKSLNINRMKDDITYMKGANWVSLNYEGVAYLIAMKKFIRTNFKHTHCCDEIYKQTVFWNSPLKNTVYELKLDDSYLSIMRMIDWKRGRPYVWTINEFEELMNSPYLFARKFDEKNMDVVDKIYIKLREMQIGY